MAGKIFANQAAIRVRPNEVCKLEIGFHNMAPCPLRYELDPKSGTITDDGIYTAPDRLGVHVIRVLCVHDPLIITFAYADVRE